MSEYRYWQSEKDGKWYWHLRAGNYFIILKSSMSDYESATEERCKTIIWTLQHGPDIREHLKILASKNGEFYFNICDDAGVLGTSETYTTRQGCRRGHATVMRNRSTDRVVKRYQ